MVLQRYYDGSTFTVTGTFVDIFLARTVHAYLGGNVSVCAKDVKRIHVCVLRMCVFCMCVKEEREGRRHGEKRVQGSERRLSASQQKAPACALRPR